MSADRTLRAMVFGLLLCGNAAIAADEDEVPEVAFLEYLGMWEETDEEWMLLDETMTADTEERSDPAPEGEESMETDDDS